MIYITGEILLILRNSADTAGVCGAAFTHVFCFSSTTSDIQRCPKFYCCGNSGLSITMWLNSKYVSRSLRKDRATVAAVSFERLRCSISARATGKAVGTGRKFLSTAHFSSLLLTFHPFYSNILELVEFFEEEDKFYLVFEKLRGGLYCTTASKLVDFQTFLYKRYLRLSCPPIRINLGSHSQETPLQRAGSQCGRARDCQCSGFPA